MSKDIVVGDHLRLGVDLYGLIPISADMALPPPGSSEPRCAGVDSVYMVDKVTNADTVIEFISVKDPKATDTCPRNAPPAQPGSQYKIKNEIYSMVSYRTTGIAFGGLIVPFKFRLGSDKKIAASPTIAPYLGFRSSWFQGFGTEVIPVVSAGLGLVPVADPSTNKTETKPAFSTAIGITMNSSKSKDFSAGILIGKDFLSRADRAPDPSVSKVWISAWVGISR
ncbi:hypothetical protein [Massilia horti]|uniref:Uncharacterized protein n=1 Tax=Massilia horti TaxID=2562153 RepID=A0A4Y9T2K2_9BURK|nr:hypothetical protein [Massilia horti]TFW31751.1 hypothetical protein E4O92_12430 [Massilia horti]